MAQNRLIDVKKSTPRFPQLALGGLKSTLFGPKSSYRGQKATFVRQKSTLRCLISNHRSKIDAQRPNSTLRSLASTLRCQSLTPTEPKISLTAKIQLPEAQHSSIGPKLTFRVKKLTRRGLNGNASLRSDAQNHLYRCALSQGLLKSILGLWWSGGLFLASKGYMDGEAIGRPPEGEI